MGNHFLDLAAHKGGETGGGKSIGSAVSGGLAAHLLRSALFRDIVDTKFGGIHTCRNGHGNDSSAVFKALGLDLIGNRAAFKQPGGSLGNRHGLSGQAGQTGGKNGNITGRELHLLGEGVQLHGLGAVIHQGVGLIGRIITPLRIGNALGLELVEAILAETADLDLVAGDLKHRHGLADFRTGIVGVIIGHKACAHISKVQGFHGEGSLASGLGDIEGIALVQEGGGAAQIIIPALRMVVAEQEDDVQALGAGLVHHIKDVLAVLGKALALGTVIVMHTQVGHNENGRVKFLCQLLVQIGLQVGSGLLDAALVIVIPHVVAFIDNKNAVAVLSIVIVAAGSQHRTGQVIVAVMVALDIHFVQVGAVEGLDRCRQRVTAVGGTFFAIALIIVTGKEEAVGALVAVFIDLRQNARNFFGTRRMVLILILEIRTGDDDNRILIHRNRCCRNCVCGHIAHNQHQAQQQGNHSL